MTYCYESESGEVIERTWSLADLEQFERGVPPQQLEVGGVVYKRSFFAERAGVPSAKGWPLECYASGVNAEQADDLRAEFSRLGIDCEVSKDGNPIYRDAAHRRKCLKARGFFDRASFY